MPKSKPPHPEKPMSMNQLAKRYGVVHTTIRNFRKEGVNIHDPAAFQSRMQQKNSAWVLPENRISGPKPKGPHIPVDAGDETEGLTSAIKRLRAAEVAAHTAYLDSLVNDEDRAAGLLKRWHGTLDMLRKVEESNPDIQKENANIVTKEELAATLGTLFKNLRQDLEALPLKVATQGQHKEKDALLQIVKEETDRIIDALFGCKML